MNRLVLLHSAKFVAKFDTISWKNFNLTRHLSVLIQLHLNRPVRNDERRNNSAFKRNQMRFTAWLQNDV